ncbi:MAG: prepilin-type N-terminal cleavage/methylation domain-containing protein [Chlamydiales bacterium]|jgi:prepilin-type N-terminal cleavage/methylation domain-containing protein
MRSTPWHEHRTRRTKRSLAAGFTLVELVVTMLVVAILSGASVLSLSGLAATQQNVAASRVRTAMIFAQEWAMGSSNDTWVSFDLGADLVSVFVDDPSNPGKAGRLAMIDPLTRGAMTVQLGGAGVGLEAASFGSTTEVQFDADGAPFDADGSTLSADGTVSVTGGIVLRVTRNTGLVTVD